MSPERRKRRATYEIHGDILRFMEKSEVPCTTGQIAEAIGINWYSASAHLAHLKANKKVAHKHVGRQNEWWIEKENEVALENKKLKEELKKLKAEIKGLKLRAN